MAWHPFQLRPCPWGEHEKLVQEVAPLNRSRTETLFAAVNHSVIMAATDLTGAFTAVSDPFCAISGYTVSAHAFLE